MGYRQGQQDADPSGREAGPESGLERARQEAARLAGYLQFGPRTEEDGGGVDSDAEGAGAEGGAGVRRRRHSPPRHIFGDWAMPAGTLSVYAIGEALVLRGDFTEGDLIALRRSFLGQLVTLDSDGEYGTLVVWPPKADSA